MQATEKIVKQASFLFLVAMFSMVALGGNVAALKGLPNTLADSAVQKWPALLVQAVKLRLSNKNDSALILLNRLKSATPDSAKNYDLLARIGLESAYCSNAQQLQAANIEVQLTSPGPGVNSAGNDFGLVFQADEALVYFSSDRSKAGVAAVYSGTKTIAGFGSVHAVGGALAAKPYITAGISVDGQQLFLLLDNEKGNPELYQSHLVSGNWSVPKKLSDRINEGLVKASVSLSPDGQYLYFSSKRPGGRGGADLYRSRLLPNGEWAVPVNLGGGVNSVFDEICPVLHPDGLTLFFSSNAPNSMGGYDIFFSSKDVDTAHWADPMNLGFPVNSAADDVFYWPTADNRGGYFASNRSSAVGGFDTYQNLFPEQREANLTVYRGTVQKGDGTVLKNVEITVTDAKTGELIGTYLPNGITGNYLIILTPGGHYNITYVADGFAIESRKLDVPTDSGYSVLNNTIELKPAVAVEKR